jgi:hypothetical protein
MDAITRADEGDVQMIDISVVRVRQQGAVAQRGRGRGLRTLVSKFCDRGRLMATFVQADVFPDTLPHSTRGRATRAAERQHPADRLVREA